MNSKHKQYADMKFEEGLHTIRSRLTHLQTTHKSNQSHDPYFDSTNPPT